MPSRVFGTGSTVAVTQAQTDVRCPIGKLSQEQAQRSVLAQNLEMATPT